jgi:hypothetical protein
MCQFLGDPRSLKHDVALTKQISAPRRPQTFLTWLLIHSDATCVSRVGLDRDADEITSVTVFGATSPQGTSVVKGLLADKRKQYTIRATTRRSLNDPVVEAIRALDPSRVTIVNADLDNIHSCQQAVEGVDGVFLVSDSYQPAMDGNQLDLEERHTTNIIDACEGRVKHLVFSTMESVDNVNPALPDQEVRDMSPKARMAAYARSKQLSVTFVLMPCYSEVFFDMITKIVDDQGNERHVLQIPLKHGNAKVMCMSVEELGPAVANIFDSYECYAGHEIGLVTDFTSIQEVQEILQEVFDETVQVETQDTMEWVEARDTHMKDLGQLFASLSRSDAVKHRHSLAKTYQLVPSAKNLRRWVESNKDNPQFREKLGLR